MARSQVQSAQMIETEPQRSSLKVIISLQSANHSGLSGGGLV